MVLLKNLEEEMEEKRVKEKARIEEENKAKEEAPGMEKLDVMKMVERAMKRIRGGVRAEGGRADGDVRRSRPSVQVYWLFFVDGGVKRPASLSLYKRPAGGVDFYLGSILPAKPVLEWT
ncbi:unnamed protein product [Gadus morhua 'NCC']